MTLVSTLNAAGAEALAASLESHDDFRVLRRMRPLARISHPAFRKGPHVSGCALDVETTGLDHRRDAVIELAMQRFSADGYGRIVDVGPPFRWLEDPGRPIPTEITALTGLTDAKVTGRRICDAEATCLVLGADFVVAHNSGFDRPFVEARLPDARGRPWICSMRDVDWRANGFEGRSLSYLLTQMGMFYEAHRADIDVSALIHLLDHRPGVRDMTILGEALANGAKGNWRVEAVSAPFHSKDLLKARGYRWNAERRHWWRDVSSDLFDAEFRWCVSQAYGGEAEPHCRFIDWTERYAAH